MGEQKRSLLRQLYLPAVLCTALWGSAAPCVKRGYELFAVSADAPFSQLVFAGWRVAGRTLWTLVGGRTAYATERFR